MDIGFTGSRLGLYSMQIDGLKLVFNNLSVFSFRHGDCVGADEIADHIARTHSALAIFIHPPKDKTLRAFVRGPNTKVHEAEDYLIRNRRIVNECNLLIACPKTLVEQRRGGTWYTIRYARERHKPVMILPPWGTFFTREELLEMKNGRIRT